LLSRQTLLSWETLLPRETLLSRNTLLSREALLPRNTLPARETLLPRNTALRLLAEEREKLPLVVFLVVVKDFDRILVRVGRDSDNPTGNI
jgi:hypothetical protein